MKYLIITLLSLLMMNFFGAIEILDKILILILLPFVFLEFHKKSIYKKYFIWLIIFLIINIISCNYFRGQSFFMTFNSTIPLFFVLFYFVLKKINLSITKMESILTLLVLFFCIAYLIQFSIYPTVIFSGAKDSELFEQGLRIRLMGQGLSSLGYFFALNKYLKNDRKTFNLFLLVLCFVVIFLMGFRTMLVMILLFSLLMIIRVKGFTWQLLFSSFVLISLFIALIQSPIFAKQIDAMLERQQTEVLTNSDYIRVIQFEYFTNQHFKSFWEYILGSGSPGMGKGGSLYGKRMEGLQNQGINWVDWGLLSLSWIIGIPAVITMISYSVKVIRLNVEPNSIYIGIWFFYLLVVSFTTMEFYRPGNFIVQAIALFIAEKSHNKYVREINKKKYENRNFDLPTGT